MGRANKALGALFLSTSLAGCIAVAAPGGGPGHDKAAELDELRDRLEGREDPVAKWLLGRLGEDALRVDFETLVKGISAVQECPEDDIRAFVVSDDLVEADPFPRFISTTCNASTDKASEFFVAASFRSEVSDTEVDLQELEVFAWDAPKGAYQFYFFSDDDPDDSESTVTVDPDPKECRKCHQTPANREAFGMPMVPIMNELAQPWTHWKAEPGFRSNGFHVPNGVESGESWGSLVEAFPGSASQLERVIRAGHRKVANARAATLGEPFEIEKALAALRPVFCAEQLNYASEIRLSEADRTGNLVHAALVDPGINNAFRAIRSVDWEWDWWNDEIMTVLTAEGEPVEGLDQIPVRGSADLAWEKRLMQEGCLSAQQILQVRALDWKNAAMSAQRCELWQTATTKYLRLGEDASRFGGSVCEGIGALYEELMTINGKPIKASGGEGVIVVPVADADSFAKLATTAPEDLPRAMCGDAGCSCTDGVCIATVTDFGNMIDLHVHEVQQRGRAGFLEARKDRICRVLETVALPREGNEVLDDRFVDSIAECAAGFCDFGDQDCVQKTITAVTNVDPDYPGLPRVAEALRACSPNRFPNRPSFPVTAEECSERDGIFRESLRKAPAPRTF